ncbi:root hair defective 3 GTP-binding protein [Erysiphe pulchra]|uniref:Root hair defective 3 GTP-binding protein n=1 Tax=Erysiphe pulchra TaxID=225359 RepID=A0A2S4PYN0_9PEZI|nr:root hair defective 3 GTP-binding protein [Erysiphe pulchra]
MVLILAEHDKQRPAPPTKNLTAPIIMNGFSVDESIAPVREKYEHGIQIIDGEKQFNSELNKYLQVTNTSHSGFNYHLISVFGSQSTGKSTLLNHLFGTQFGVMSETERRQTTKGIWMSVNKQETSDQSGLQRMADGILVMDVEGTDGRERGEDQDFERKSALFALATSEVIILNIWEHQVGLYQGANMGLLKTVFEVNLQLFLNDKQSTPRSLLFFVIRDHLGTTPLANLRNTLIGDLSNIWASLSKPAGLENSRIEDYFDFAFSTLPHKILQPNEFLAEVKKLGNRFRVGKRPVNNDFESYSDSDIGVFLPEYHRRIPADGFSVYAEGVWDQIVSNKDLDLPSQQELLAQFRCDEISREVLNSFDNSILILEEKQVEGAKLGNPIVLKNLGAIGKKAREDSFRAFEIEAGRYHKGVFIRKQNELEAKIDSRLKILYRGQLSAVHKSGIISFSSSVSAAVKAGQNKNLSYEFAEIVSNEKKIALEKFESEAKDLIIKDVSWTDFTNEFQLYSQELDAVSTKLRKEEIRRLVTRLEKWIRSRLGELVSLEFNKLGSTRQVSGTSEVHEGYASEKDFWDRIWSLFTSCTAEAAGRFTERARSFEADHEEVENGLWRLKRKSWIILRAKLDEEVMEGNIMTKLRENFEDKFRYDETGVPRIWRPTDDIEGIYTKAKDSTLDLIPRLSKFKLSKTQKPPALQDWIGSGYSQADFKEEEDLIPIGGVDEEDGKSLDEEMTILSEAKRQDLVARFKKQADGVYIEAKRSAIGGVTEIPLYFWVIVLFLGWNELLAVLRNPIYFVFLLTIGTLFYITWTLNLWGPILSMVEAASAQGIDIGKAKLREFLENNENSRHAFISKNSNIESIRLKTLDNKGKYKEENED